MRLEINQNQKIGLACAAAVLIGAYVFSGMTGVFGIIIMGILFVLPTYIFLSSFQLDFLEKAFFSFFLGIGMFSVIAYLVSFLFPSLKISIGLTFVIMMGAAIGTKRLRK